MQHPRWLLLLKNRGDYLDKNCSDLRSLRKIYRELFAQGGEDGFLYESTLGGPKRRNHTTSAAPPVSLNGISGQALKVGVRPARTQDIPLKVAVGAQADPSIVAAFFKQVALGTPQLSQRLWVDAKNSRHIGGGHPFAVVHGG